MTTETDKKKDEGMEKRAVVNTPAEKQAAVNAEKFSAAQRAAAQKIVDADKKASK